MDRRYERRVLKSLLKAFLFVAAASIWVTFDLVVAQNGVIGQELLREQSVTSPSEQDRLIAKKVGELIVKHHVSSHAMDDEISARAFRSLLKKFDPLKIYLQQSDFNEFQKSERTLDDLVEEGEIDFVYTLYRRFLQRVRESIPIRHEWIAFQHDFSIDEELSLDADSLDYPSSSTEAKERWRKSTKYSLLKLDQEGKRSNEAQKILHLQVAKEWQEWEQINNVDLLEFFLTSITKSFDPHSNYRGSRSQENFNLLARLELQGIGAKLESRDGVILVTSLIPGGAADRDARLKAGDQIIAIAQEEGDPVAVHGMRLDAVVSLIRGEVGTKIRLTVEPNGGGPFQIYELTRVQIQLQEGAAFGQVVEHGAKKDGKPFRFAYIGLPSFYLDSEGAQTKQPNFRSATRDVRRILLEMKQKGIDGVLLDLSQNDRGALSEAIESVGLFIDHGPVVQVKGADGNLRSMEDLEAGVTWDGPLVIITSRLSVSASEVFAGAIRSYERGLIVGDPNTHGKGTVQSILEVNEALPESQESQASTPESGRKKRPPLGALRVSSQQFYLPDGSSTQSQGVEADVVLPSIAAEMKIGEANLEFAMSPSKVPAIDYKKVGLVNQAMRRTLQQGSQKRMHGDAAFSELKEQIEKYRKHGDKKTVPLNSKRFLAEAAVFNKEKTEQESFARADRTLTEFPSNAYYQEVLEIAADYVDLLRGMQQLTD